MGPTGAGKTPLGDLIEQQGMNEKKCFHFDFGENLRRAASGSFSNDVLSPDDLDFLKKVLSSGAFLENETFYIAEKIFKAFIHENKASRNDLIIMNGLPRHIDQANDTAAMVEIKAVAVLECTPDIVFERIRLNTGGDRSRRDDDALIKIKNKLGIYSRRTLPLLGYFSDKNIPVKTIRVNALTTAEEMMNVL